MKKAVFLLLFCFSLASCSRKNYIKAEEQETLVKEEIILEEKTPSVSYVFDIDSFKFLDEYPKTIAGIKALYPNELFEERIAGNEVKGIVGKYVYSLDSLNIQFGFWGDTPEEADLKTVEILNPDYQCKSIQVIGMTVEEIERISGEKLKPDKNIKIYTDLNFLSIRTKNGIVQNYIIMELL